MLNACIVKSCNPLDSTAFDLCDFESQLYALNSVKTIIFFYLTTGRNVTNRDNTIGS